MQAGCNCIGADGLQHGWLLLQHQALRNLSYAQHVRHAVPCSSSVVQGSMLKGCHWLSSSTVASCSPPLPPFIPAIFIASHSRAFVHICALLAPPAEALQLHHC